MTFSRFPQKWFNLLTAGEEELHSRKARASEGEEGPPQGRAREGRAAVRYRVPRGAGREVRRRAQTSLSR